MGRKPVVYVCWKCIAGARDVLETKRGVSAAELEDTGKFLWRPDIRRV